MTETKSTLAEAYAGSEGQPGSHYTVMYAKLFKLTSGRYQCVVHAERGSNQGHLEAHDEADLEGRGNSILDAIDTVRVDVEDWEGWLTSQERHQLLRSLEYDSEDSGPTKASINDLRRQIRHLTALLIERNEVIKEQRELLKNKA